MACKLAWSISIYWYLCDCRYRSCRSVDHPFVLDMWANRKATINHSLCIKFSSLKISFSISNTRKLGASVHVCTMCQKRETLASRPPRAASWLRSGALRAQAAVAQGWCHVVGIYSSKFNFQLSFLPWQKPCAWDCRHPAVLMWVIRHDEITDPLVISLRSSSATTVLVVCCELKRKTCFYKQSFIYQQEDIEAG